MSKKVAYDKKVEKAMVELGKVITDCRKEKSLRKVAEPCGIPASQLLAIEKGTFAPTAEVYAKLINTLCPSAKKKEKMDKLFMAIRGTPPPDVCKIIIKNEVLNDVLRQIGNGVLTAEQVEKINDLIKTFDLKQGEETDG